MTTQEFKNIKILDNNWSPFLKALWHDGQGNWTAAHKVVDTMGGKNAAWVHAYLHRKEGDQWNANYWYRRANQTMPNVSLDEEWEALVQYFLN
jgi:hypothetical protein